jgi:hypothetical protein
MALGTCIWCGCDTTGEKRWCSKRHKDLARSAIRGFDLYEPYSFHRRSSPKDGRDWGVVGNVLYRRNHLPEQEDHPRWDMAVRMLEDAQ